MKPELRKKMEIEDSILLNIEDIQRDLIEQIAVAEQKTDEAEPKANEAELELTESKLKVVLKSKIKGMSTDVIVEVTGLSFNDVENI
jgi:hypothetical protein